MAWDVVSQTQLTVVPAANLNKLQDNFAALAAQNSGAPVIGFPNSWGVANAGFVGAAVSSFHAYNAASGFRTTQVASVGLLDASSGVQVNVVAPAAPVAGRFYKDTAILAWAAISSVGAIVAEMGIAAVANPATGIFVITLATSFQAARSWIPAGSGLNSTGADVVTQYDPNSQTGGSIALAIVDVGGILRNRGFSFIAVGS